MEEFKRRPLDEWSVHLALFLSLSHCRGVPMSMESSWQLAPTKDKNACLAAQSEHMLVIAGFVEHCFCQCCVVVR